MLQCQRNLAPNDAKNYASYTMNLTKSQNLSKIFTTHQTISLPSKIDTVSRFQIQALRVPAAHCSLRACCCSESLRFVVVRSSTAFLFFLLIVLVRIAMGLLDPGLPILSQVVKVFRTRVDHILLDAPFDAEPITPSLPRRPQIAWPIILLREAKDDYHRQLEETLAILIGSTSTSQFVPYSHPIEQKMKQIHGNNLHCQNTLAKKAVYTLNPSYDMIPCIFIFKNIVVGRQI